MSGPATGAPERSPRRLAPGGEHGGQLGDAAGAGLGVDADGRHGVLPDGGRACGSQRSQSQSGAPSWSVST